MDIGLFVLDPPVRVNYATERTAVAASASLMPIEASSASTAATGMRRWPPGVRTASSAPVWHHRDTVVASTRTRPPTSLGVSIAGRSFTSPYRQARSRDGGCLSCGNGFRRAGLRAVPPSRLRRVARCSRALDRLTIRLADAAQPCVMPFPDGATRRAREPRRAARIGVGVDRRRVVGTTSELHARMCRHTRPPTRARDLPAHRRRPHDHRRVVAGPPTPLSTELAGNPEPNAGERRA